MVYVQSDKRDHNLDVPKANDAFAAVVALNDGLRMDELKTDYVSGRTSATS